jgi:hypothetical protein
MSETTKFKFYRPFPFCPVSTSPGANFSFVDLTLAQAMPIWWNLEEFELVTTGTRGSLTIDATNALGPTESLSFTPTVINRSGSYYTGSTPARQPNTKVCLSNGSVIGLNSNTSSGGVVTILDVSIQVRASGNPSLPVRLFYAFRFNQNTTTEGVNILSPSAAAFTGTPPSSGTVSLLGVTLDWIGGGYTISGAVRTWASETATAVINSSAFSYPA